MGLRDCARDRVVAVVDRLFGRLNEDVRAHMGACTPVDMRRELPNWRDIDAATAALELFTSWGATIVAFTGDAMDLFGNTKRHERLTGSASFCTVEVKPGVMRVLPPDIEERVRTDILQFARRGALLKRTGLEMKRGVLLHGPPGTGKTLLCRLLATELQGFTTIVVAGDNLQGPSSVFALARRLAPSLVVLEDVDLIGRNRDDNSMRTKLGSLLNELDGMGRQDQVIVVLTTNRLKDLEEALVDRSGRVDTVIGLPVPSAELRRHLLHRFAGKAVVDDDAVDVVVERTNEASPAFLREVMKRAVLQCPEPAGDAAVVVDKAAALRALSGMIDAHRDRAERRIIGFVR